MTYKALIFDCDGTLMDSLGNALESFHFALDQMGVPRSTPEILRYFGVSADRILFQLLGDETRTAKAYDVYKNHQRLLAPKTRIFPGVLDLLQTARRASVPLGIVTGRHRQDLEILLQPHGLLEYFPVIVTDDELSRPKPSPEGLNKALSLMGVPAAQAYYIGDSASDMQAAHAAGVRSIAALWYAKVERQKLSEAGPFAVAETPAEVWRIFAEA